MIFVTVQSYKLSHTKIITRLNRKENKKRTFFQKSIDKEKMFVYNYLNKRTKILKGDDYI